MPISTRSNSLVRVVAAAAPCSPPPVAGDEGARGAAYQPRLEPRGGGDGPFPVQPSGRPSPSGQPTTAAPSRKLLQASSLDLEREKGTNQCETREIEEKAPKANEIEIGVFGSLMGMHSDGQV
uniref:Uncharacterized protein n=1 Tax=Oryza glumipatula TaxID=40148 RepID=A0A0D9ZM26_9ORYZ